MKNVYQHFILVCVTVILIICISSCTKQTKVNIAGIWYETLQTGQSIHGGHIDSITSDTSIYQFTSSGRFNIEWHSGANLHRDSGSYLIQNDSLYLMDQIYGYRTSYYLATANSQSLVLKLNLVECTSICDTVIQTDYLHR